MIQLPGTIRGKYNLLGTAIAPNITFTVPPEVTICPFSSYTFALPIINHDTSSEYVSYSGNDCVLSEQNATISSGGVDSLLATFAGADTGVYNLQVTVTDECGIATLFR